MPRRKQPLRYRPSQRWWLEMWLVSLVLPAFAIFVSDRLSLPSPLRLLRFVWYLAGPVLAAVAIWRSELNAGDKLVWAIGTVFLMPLMSLVVVVGLFETL